MKLDPTEIESITKLAAYLKNSVEGAAPELLTNPRDFFVHVGNGTTKLIKRFTLLGMTDWAKQLQGDCDTFNKLFSETLGVMTGDKKKGFINNEEKHDKLYIGLLAGKLEGSVFALADTLGQIASIAEQQIMPNGTASKSRPKTRRVSSANDGFQIVSALLEHHRFDSGELNYEPATQEIIAMKLGWKQDKVSKVIAKFYRKHWWRREYIPACKTKMLTGFLTKLDDSSMVVEASHNRPMHPTEREEKFAKNE